MRDIQSRQTKFIFAFLLSAVVALISGCGGSGTTTSATTPATTTTLTPAGTTPVAAPTLTLSLVDAATSLTTVTSISTSTPARAKAILTDANGIVVPNTVVTFTTDATLAAMTPIGGTALTDTAGIAYIALAPASFIAAGASTITATAQVGTAAVTGSVGYSIGASTLTMSAITLGAGSTVAAPLSAFGTTSVSVTVNSGGSPITSPQVVTFTSSCAGSGKAALSASVTTVSGVATGSYRDNGCAGSDIITASVGSLTTPQNATIYVTAPTAGSLQYVSSTPASIGLSGMGGITSSQVAFKVVDGGGNPVSGKAVTFGLSTSLGGITLTPSAPATATSDSSGMVYINVNAGIFSTPVRVTATTCTTNPISPCTGTPLSTQSSELTITTGIPSQSSFSLATTTYNIEGWNIDGTTTTLTSRLADHFGNPVPNGTSVNFITEGARVASSCTTLNGDCSAVFNSQNFRPSNGRVTVLAYAVGEESFIDLDGNGVASSAAELFDANAVSTDMPEAWVDYNENGTREASTEPYIDFNSNYSYDLADTKFNGVLCDAAVTPALCGTTKTVHVRQDIVIILSGSYPYVSHNAPVSDDLLCNGPIFTHLVRISDIHNNHMPAGTTVTFTASGNGKLAGTTTFIVPNTNASLPNADNVTPGTGNIGYISATTNTVLATSSDANYSVTVTGDGTIDAAGVCTDTTKSGVLTVTTTTPSGISVTRHIVNLIN